MLNAVVVVAKEGFVVVEIGGSVLLVGWDSDDVDKRNDDDELVVWLRLSDERVDGVVKVSYRSFISIWVDVKEKLVGLLGEG